MRTANDDRLDRLAMELSGHMDGWQNEDVMRVCAALAVAAIGFSQDTRLKRLELLELIFQFMLQSLQGMEESGLVGRDRPGWMQ